MENVPTIITRSDEFHADTVWGVALVRVFFPGFSESVTIKQSSLIHIDQYVLTDQYANLIAVVDTGGVYNPEAKMYDDAGTKHLTKKDGSRYSTAGLIWKDIRTVTDLTYGCFKTAVLDEVMRRIDSAEYREDHPNWYLSNIIKSCNPSDVSQTLEREKRFDKLCAIAVQSINDLLDGKISTINEIVDLIQKDQIVLDWLKEKDDIHAESAARVTNVLANKLNIRKNNKLEQFVLICTRHEPAIVDTLGNISSELIFCIHPHGTAAWVVEGIPMSPGSKEVKKRFPKSWLNIPPEDISRMYNIPAGLVHIDQSRKFSIHSDLDSAAALAYLVAVNNFPDS